MEEENKTNDNSNFALSCGNDNMAIEDGKLDILSQDRKFRGLNKVKNEANVNQPCIFSN